MTASDLTITRGPYAALDEWGRATVLRSASGSAPMHIGGETFLSTGALTIDQDNTGMEIRHATHPWEAVHECVCCHRFDTREIVARSFEEAVNFGWLIPVANASEVTE